MKIFTDFHTHTSYCDGADTVEQMVQTAYKKGLSHFGISGHTAFPYPAPYGMDERTYESYAADILEQKDRYKGRMHLFLGIEEECIRKLPIPAGLMPWTKQTAKTPKPDYVIGSCHCILKDGQCITVDESEEALCRAVLLHYGGDWYRLVRDYYETEALVAVLTDCQIIGHFDLITKFNRGQKYFDETKDDYMEPALFAMRELIHADIPFEINTGAVSRGYKTENYPSEMLLKALFQMGGKVMINSDSHSAKTIAYGYEQAASDLYKAGFREIWHLSEKGGYDKRAL